MRIRIIIAFIVLFGLLWSTSCRKDFEYNSSSGNLTFSKDTVYLDTVFSNIGSSTYTLKVYNNTKEDALIPSIALKKGPESFYRLNVDGVAGKSFTNTPIYAKDSLFILIETTINITDETKELLYTDTIEFDANQNLQSVTLVTLAKDAILLFPKDDSESNTKTITLYTDNTGNSVDVTGFEFKDEELSFTNNKPYVVYGYGIIPENKQLIIDPGARVYFHENSGILVQQDATITINGILSENQETLEGQVVFEGDRLEPEFSELPGQWGGLWISKGSINNSIEYLTIKNAQVGLFIEGESEVLSRTLNINNSQLFNNGKYNIWSKNAKLVSENLVLGGAGSSSLFIENGGSYDFTHATIANFWNKGFRINTALEIKNNSTQNPETGVDLVQANFKNCIIDGNIQSEISLLPNGEDSFNFNFQNCFIKYSSSPPAITESETYNFENSPFYTAVILEGDVDYYSPSNNDFRIGLASEVIEKGDAIYANKVPFDIIGTERNTPPDLGAFQAQEKE